MHIVLEESLVQHHAPCTSHHVRPNRHFCPLIPCRIACKSCRLGSFTCEHMFVHLETQTSARRRCAAHDCSEQDRVHHQQQLGSVRCCTAAVRRGAVSVAWSCWHNHFQSNNCSVHSIHIGTRMELHDGGLPLEGIAHCSDGTSFQ